MYAAVLEEYGEPVVIEEREVPTVAPDGVVVSVEACGICRSDWHGWRGDWDWLGGGPDLTGPKWSSCSASRD
jgi:D-arabinose 1-dehydrogenase-like Zn-dependent alcohol dehydrogenase